MHWLVIFEQGRFAGEPCGKDLNVFFYHKDFVVKKHTQA
jgi:hypothetical protein